MQTFSAVRICLKVAVVCVFLTLSIVIYYVQNIRSVALPIPKSGYNFFIAPGSSLTKLTEQLDADAIVRFPTIVRWYAVGMGYETSIKAGEYNIKPGTTAMQLLDQVVRGAVVQHTFTVIEGWRVKNLITALHANPNIKNTLQDLNEQEIISKLNLPLTNLEGMFLADTYYITAGTTDVAFLRRAHNALQTKLQQEWEQRADNTLLQDPYQALILASIIEKESGAHEEYAEISGVFQRRIKLGMRLQADPCVIYGLGVNYTGALSKTHLVQDSPYNTYTRNGLPPTPIAIPSMRAVHAALHPAEGDNMYFVATREGKHVFSKDLVSHNTAVQKYRE